ncbi:MAG: hypothetical protein ACR2JI_12700 [Mycobacterium sp.]
MRSALSTGSRIPVGITALGAAVAVWAAPQALAEPVDAPPAPQAEVVAATTASSVVPPDGVPHLPSPDSLPPGTTQIEPEHRNLSYLRDIWNAVRNQDVTMSQALLLIAQRPMDAPTTGMSPHPVSVESTP